MNLKPKVGTEGSLKPVIAANGMVSRSGLREKDRLTSKPIAIDRQIPELVLENDGHFVGIFLAHRRGDGHARRLRLEGNVEMMIAGQAVASRIAKHLANNRSQGFLNQKIVSNMIGRHCDFALALLFKN